jgi:hypothetical protein
VIITYDATVIHKDSQCPTSQIKYSEKENMKNTTTGLTDTLIETLDVQNFIKEVREFDNVTQRQCLLKARRELRKPLIMSLYGPELTRKAMTEIRTELGETAN